MTLPVVVPSDAVHTAGRPVRAVPSRSVLWAGCGLVGARYTVRSPSYTAGVAREFWYDTASGALVGTALRATDQRVDVWGEGPPESCALTVCDPSTMIQRDPWVPAAQGQFDFRRYCDLEDVGLDPALQGDWVRDDGRTARARAFRLEPLQNPALDGPEALP